MSLMRADRATTAGWVVVWLAVSTAVNALAAEAPPAVPPPPKSAEDWLTLARDAQTRGLMKRAIELAGKAVEAAPADPRVRFVRASMFERTREFDLAEIDLTQAIEVAPTEAALLFQRAMARLRLAKFDGAVADFDRFAELRPSRLPELWQRGIALFYAGRYDDGRRQFELHRTVNPRDVENSAWHFLCVARLEGLESARKRVLPCTGDERVPMKEIQALLAGQGTPEQVSAAAEAVPEGPARETAQFYAQLYLALFREAEGRRDVESRLITEAVKLADAHGIMGDVARLHADWLAREMRKGRR